jgi:hypothetical protein
MDSCDNGVCPNSPFRAILTMTTPRELLDRLDTRHDELIDKLDNLNAQIEKALAEIFKNRAATSREVAIAPTDAGRRAA